jgi:hypothetical protein
MFMLPLLDVGHRVLSQRRERDVMAMALSVDSRKAIPEEIKAAKVD